VFHHYSTIPRRLTVLQRATSGELIYSLKLESEAFFATESVSLAPKYEMNSELYDLIFVDQYMALVSTSNCSERKQYENFEPEG
jgi:hypothetical protein